MQRNEWATSGWRDLLRTGLSEDCWQWDWTTLGSLKRGGSSVRAIVVAKSEGIWAAQDLTAMMDVFSTETQALQGIQQGWGPLDGKHVVKFAVLLGAQPSIHEDVLPVCPNQQTSEAERDAIQIIGGATLLPQDFRDDPEHGPAIQVLAPAFHKYLVACPPRVASPHFRHMRQRVTLAPLQTDRGVVGTMITLEDVTERLDRERTIAAMLQHPMGEGRRHTDAALA